MHKLDLHAALGSFLGEAPTSNEVVLHGITIFRFRDGLIAEDWEAMDEQPLLNLTKDEQP